MRSQTKGLDRILESYLAIKPRCVAVFAEWIVERLHCKDVRARAICREMMRAY